MTVIFLLFLSILAFWFAVLMIIGLVQYLRRGHDLSVGSVLAILVTILWIFGLLAIGSLSVYHSINTLLTLTGKG